MTDNYGRNLDYRIDLAVLALRRHFNLSQRDLAKRLNTTRQQITKLERRTFDPTIETVNRLAAAFGMSPRAFVSLATIKA
jgi:transcriptional regulator with XRE-family HTH domain